MPAKIRIGFGGDRAIAVQVLDYMLQQGVQPLALLVAAEGKSSHAGELVSRCPFLAPEAVLRGSEFTKPDGIRVLRELNLDYVICVHFPYVVPSDVLSIPRSGFLNLHPAYLPFNRGWHTASWALLDKTPIGATLHFMDSGIDTGDIVRRRRVQVSPGDTAHTLYQRLLAAELELFKRAWPNLVSGSFRRKRQENERVTQRSREELLQQEVQRIDLNEMVRAEDLIRRLRALTTSRVDEAAYYEVDGVRYRIQVLVAEEIARQE
jgi:methionyl-tRNA formyltransferase